MLSPCGQGDESGQGGGCLPRGPEPGGAGA